MTHTSHFRFFSRWLLAGALALTAPLISWAQQAADPPGRVAYVSALDGSAWIATSERGGEWARAALNWPVTTGTRLTVDAGARAEVHGGWTALRLAGRSQLDMTRLDDGMLQAALTDGQASLRVRELQPGERVELDTPQLALVANQPGEYRVDVDPRADTTRVTVFAGAATLYGEAGQSTTVQARQQVLVAGGGLNVVQRGAAAYRDSLDQWAATRDAQEAQSRSARYVSPATPGYQLLDQYGEWSQDPTYGAVWYPTVTVADWAPYRYGRWTWVAPWGWTWVDDAPWGFAPSHYGRWAQIGPRWAWVPGPVTRRPVYAPAVVGFVGGSNWNASIGSGAAWFPLAPGEYWRPAYHASDRYRDRVNWGRPRPPRDDDDYRYQRRPDAISVAPPGGFGREPGGRRPGIGDGNRPPFGMQASPPPGRGEQPAGFARPPVPMPRPEVTIRPPRDGAGGWTGERPDNALHRPMPAPRPEVTMRPDPRPTPHGGIDSMGERPSADRPPAGRFPSAGYGVAQPPAGYRGDRDRPVPQPQAVPQPQLMREPQAGREPMQQRPWPVQRVPQEVARPPREMPALVTPAAPVQRPPERVAVPQPAQAPRSMPGFDPGHGRPLAERPSPQREHRGHGPGEQP